MKGNLDEIVFLSQEHGWEEIEHQESTKMVSFTKDNIRVNVYYTKMTVGITGKIGKFAYQKFIYNVSNSLLVEILNRAIEFLRTGKSNKKIKK